VREVIRGRPRVEECSVNGLTAQTLNDHYSAISTDLTYTFPKPIHSGCHRATTMESSQNHAHAESYKASSAERIPANLDHTGLVPDS